MDAAGGRALVAGDIGPTGEIMAPLGTLDAAEAEDVFAEQAAALIAGGVDLIWIETMSHLSEIEAAIRGVRRASPGDPDRRDDDVRHARLHDDGRVARGRR